VRYRQVTVTGLSASASIRSNVPEVGGADLHHMSSNRAAQEDIEEYLLDRGRSTNAPAEARSSRLPGPYLSAAKEIRSGGGRSRSASGRRVVCRGLIQSIIFERDRELLEKDW